MIYSYKDYLKSDLALTIEDAMSIHEEMNEEIGNDTDAIELYEELLRKAIEYSLVRAKWTTMSTEEKADADQGRTFKHNSLIVKFNQLAKYLKMQGKAALWRDKLGYEEDDKLNRKRIGDMGCYLVFIHAINAR